MFFALIAPEFNGNAAPWPQDWLTKKQNPKKQNKGNWRMAAVSIAFEAPETIPHSIRGFRPSRTRPIDLVHLANQTMGDKALEIEVLQTFARQARACLQEIGKADATLSAIAVHRLRGAASAVGAFHVSAAAESLEASPADAGLLGNLGVAVIEAENFILKLCR